MRKYPLILSLAFLVAVVPFCFAQAAQTAPPKRPMTFEDMMKMKRLGETAVSPDGKWLAYSVTTVTWGRTPRRRSCSFRVLQAERQDPLAGGQPGDSGPQFSADGHSVLFLSGRESGRQIWLADFDTATGMASNPKKLTNIDTGADNALWSPTATPWFSLLRYFRIARRSPRTTAEWGTNATLTVTRPWRTAR